MGDSIKRDSHRRGDEGPPGLTAARPAPDHSKFRGVYPEKINSLKLAIIRPMDPIKNPFAPGAGTPPPELAGRDELITTVHVAIERVRLGLPTKSVLIVGLRGVGKTVLLDRM